MSSLSIFAQITQNPALEPFLPFFFVLAIVFGLLQIIDVFNKKSVNLIISLVFASFAAGYKPFIEFFFQYFGLVLWAFIILFFIAFLMRAVGLEKSKVKKGEENVPVVMGGIIILLLFTLGVQFLPEMSIGFLTKRDIFLIVGIGLLALMFFYAYRFHSSVKREASKMAQS